MDKNIDSDKRESKPTVFLDRDGVINKMVYNKEFGLIDSPCNPDEFELIPESGKVINQLNEMGWLTIVISNQPGIAKGKYTEKTLGEITNKMKADLSSFGARLDDIYYCLHHPQSILKKYKKDCECRKPKPGLLKKAAEKWGISLSNSYFIGDGISDIIAGKLAGTKTILLANKKLYVLKYLEEKRVEPDFIVDNLYDALQIIIEDVNNKRKWEREMSYSREYIEEAQKILDLLNSDEIERMALLIDEVRQSGGRLFIMGSGGGAAHASHAVCDFRKIVGIEAYTPSDNVAELTARVNDDGWDSAYVNWLKTSKLSKKDIIFIFSVGGGDLEKNISPNLVQALRYANEIGSRILGVVGRNGGYTAEIADACIIIPTVNPANITAHTESFQALIWHLLVSHPYLRKSEMKWESIS